MTTFLNLGSLALGLGAWVLAWSAIRGKTSFAAYRRSIGSLSVCAVSLLFQLLEIAHRVNIGDFSAIADTIRATAIAACVLIVMTTLLNIIAAIMAAMK